MVLRWCCTSASPEAQPTTQPVPQPPQDAVRAAREPARGAGQTAAAPPAIARAPSARGTVPPQVALLMSRASEMLALGDLSAARLLYQRAATLGSAQAATALGRTYDPAYLATMKATGIQPDRAAAAAWYRKGVALGDPEAADRLISLGPVP